MGRHWGGIVGQGTLAPFNTPFPEASLHRGTHNRGVIYDFTDGKMMAKIRSRFRTTSKLIEREMFSTALSAATCPLLQRRNGRQVYFGFCCFRRSSNGGQHTHKKTPLQWKFFSNSLAACSQLIHYHLAFLQRAFDSYLLAGQFDRLSSISTSC